MAKRFGKYKVSKKESELSLRDGGPINGAITSTLTNNYIDFLSGYQGNLTGTAVALLMVKLMQLQQLLHWLR